MDELPLRRLFQRVLLSCLTAPAILGTVACGGSTETSSGHSDATTDTGTRSGGDAGHRPANDAGPRTGGDGGGGDSGPTCQPSACGGCSCGPGCLQTTTCVDGQTVWGCNCDAGIDAGLNCNPDRTSCSFYLPLDCLDAAVPTDGGPISSSECQSLCGSTTAIACYLVEASGGANVLGCACGLGGGRRPPGYRPLPAKRGTATGRYFASMARLEAASVDAFANLRAELAAHGAPPALLQAAANAEADEVVHARMVGSLARRRGSTFARPRPHARRVRSLEAIAIENAVEGCVRETFGALTATHQANAASDPAVRKAMTRIAIDETRHAALAWAVARWMDGKLDDAGRAHVATATRDAVRELASEVREELPMAVRVEAGLPAATHALHMIDELRRELWTDAAAA